MGEAAAKLEGGAAVAPSGSREVFPGAGHRLADGMDEGCHNREIEGLSGLSVGRVRVNMPER